jgi:RimJ/RimL family protein N-acetyltransferase
MIQNIRTSVAPDSVQVAAWASRLRMQKNVAAAREMLFHLKGKFPDDDVIASLMEWHRPEWWQDLSFGGIRLVRRTPEHFEFVWSVILNEEFSKKLKHIPEGLNPKDLLKILAFDQAALIPESRSIQWIIFKGDTPIGLSMFLNINFFNRSAEQILGILPEFDHTFDVSSAYCASLAWAFNAMGLNKVYGLIYGGNAAAAELQERLGFRREAYFKNDIWNERTQNYDDMMQIGLLQEEFDSNPRLQKLVQRGQRSPWLMTRQYWPRRPITLLQE